MNVASLPPANARSASPARIARNACAMAWLDDEEAVATVHTVGRVNFLDDPAQVPHCKSQILYEFFGVVQSTEQNKSKEIRDALLMGPMSPEWTLPSRLADNPLVWMLQVDGLMIDIRHAPVELQRLAYEKGLIPFIPAERSSADA